MFDIEIANSQDSLDVDESFLQNVAQRTLAEERVTAAQISIALVDHATIRELNRTYLNHDEETDVLSFLLESEEQPDHRPATSPRGAGKRLDGEVIISTDMAIRTAAKFHWSPHEEVVLYLVHGLLHLTGYDDRTDAEKQCMRSRERTILNLWGLKPIYDDTTAQKAVSDRSGPARRVSGGDS